MFDLPYFVEEVPTEAGEDPVYFCNRCDLHYHEPEIKQDIERHRRESSNDG